MTRPEDPTDDPGRDPRDGDTADLGADLDAAAGAERARFADEVPGYRLLEPLGEGGYGIVHLAEQLRPVRRLVAIKVLKPGMDSRGVVARFEQERETLARLEHPNIARVFDGGCMPSGRPYFVMERVDGVPITEYLEGDRDLRRTLELFRTVCLAVHHAHQRGVIHRDIKPSNVLVAEVDGVATPKVIDFGVAKAIHDDGAPDDGLDASLRTQEGQMIGTLAFMSPEQLRGEADVDTRVDVYALGVMLFNMVTGALPFDPRRIDIQTFRTAVLDDDPPRASTALRRSGDTTRASLRVPRELDWVLLKCLAKERDARYPGVLALAEDVERLLHDRPVEAAPPSVTYRLRKFLRRHRAASAAALVVALGLAVGAVVSAWGLLEARRQAKVAAAINDFFTRDILGSVQPSVAPGRGRDVTLREVLDRAAARVGAPGSSAGFATDPRVEAQIRLAIGEAYLGLGEIPDAEVHLERAQALWAAEFGDDHPNVLGVTRQRAAVLRFLGRFEEAEALLRDALAAIERRGAVDDVEVARTLEGLALSHASRGDCAEAARICARILDLVADDDDLAHQSIRENVAVALARCGRGGDAAPLFRRALEVKSAAFGPDDPDVLTAALNFAVSRRAADPEEAMRRLEDLVPRQRRVLGDGHPEYLTAAYNLGELSREAGRIDEADRILGEALDGATRVGGSRQLITLHMMGAVARVREAQGRVGEAEAITREALAAVEETVGARHVLMVAFLNDLAAQLAAQGRDEELEGVLRRALTAAEDVFGAEDPRTALTRGNLVQHLRRQGRDTEAAEIDRAAGSADPDDP